jgi:hypothetical protein
MRIMLRGWKRGIRLGMRDRVEDLDFADDICILDQRFRGMEGKLRRLQD